MTPTEYVIVPDHKRPTIKKERERGRNNMKAKQIADFS